MKHLNAKLTEAAEIERLKKAFDTAIPYRHIVVDNFLEEDLANRLNANFPSVSDLRKHWKGINEKKSEGSEFEKFHPAFTELLEALKTPEFYQWVAKVTGIEEVFITDDHMGAGIHQGTNGSFLDIHIDFNIHHKLNVHRRLNLLIYLEKGWKKEYGGGLELWNADMTKCEQVVEVEFNRMAMFETSEISYHGYGKINIPENMSRKSFYSYYYTNEREDAAPYHDTIFKSRPDEGAVKKMKTKVKENVKNTAKSTLKKLGFKKF